MKNDLPYQDGSSCVLLAMGEPPLQGSPTPFLMRFLYLFSQVALTPAQFASTGYGDIPS